MREGGRWRGDENMWVMEGWIITGIRHGRAGNVAYTVDLYSCKEASNLVKSR